MSGAVREVSCQVAASMEDRGDRLPRRTAALLIAALSALSWAAIAGVALAVTG